MRVTFCLIIAQNIDCWSSILYKYRNVSSESSHFLKAVNMTVY